MANRRRLIGLISGAAGVVALFAPFVLGVSPLRAILDYIDLLPMAAPFLLAIPIAAWQVRQLATPLPTRAETILAYILSTISMLPVVLWSFCIGWRQARVLAIAALIVSLCAVAGNVSLLVRNRLHRLAPSVVAEVYLLLGYLPNALFLLIMFSWTTIWLGPPSWHWSWGAYIVVATCIMYVAQVLSLLRSHRPPSPQTDAEGDGLPATRS